MRTDRRLAGKVALVSGASSGIGRAVALAMGEAGMRVGLMGRRIERLAQLSGEIEQRGGEALCLAADVTDEEQVAFSLRAVAEKLGAVEVLVNSAGLGRDAPLLEGETAAFREMLEVNVLALAALTREVVRRMREAELAGHVVHISSMSAYRVQRPLGMYAATKHAVRALTEGLRRELREQGSAIRVTAISPADTDTEFMASFYGSEQEARRRRPPYRALSAEDVADAVIYALGTPPHVEIHDILMRPLEQPD